MENNTIIVARYINIVDIDEKAKLIDKIIVLNIIFFYYKHSGGCF